jgi:nicotinate-nucleotide adenylyltransferase
MNKIGLFRGSFDPPHMGHVFAAVQSLVTMDLDEVWVLPVFNHPFGKNLTDYKTRFSMVVAAFSGLGSNISVKAYDECNESGHCIELLRWLNNVYPTNKYVMLGGTDVDSGGKHKDVDEVLKLCTVARVARASYAEDKYAIPNYSSSEIKKLVSEGKSIEGLVPREVLAFINKSNLYKGIK